MAVAKARDVREMFGRIVPRYDLLNRLMSLGMDRRWRRMAAAAAEPQAGVALDLGTGTGDLAEELRRQGASHVVGADFSAPMLSVARSKVAAGSTDGTDAGSAAKARRSWLLADGLHLPFPSGAFDCVTNAFVLRNLENLRAGLSEMARVLKPDGRLVCLDMTQPPPGLFGGVYRLYFNRVLPPLAGTLSGDRAAYRYLPHSLEGFPAAPALAELLAHVGLTRVEVTYLGGGAVALHVGRRPV
jgi:demethylmenaquinone methyltransferase/2-methoxy-6-polyprenyl-1,4-benzoquinol methylase